MTALLEESEGVGEKDRYGLEREDDLDGLFDDDGGEEEYKEGVEEEEGRAAGTEEDAVSELFGDVDDIEHEEKVTKGKASGAEAGSNEALQGLCHGMALSL